METHLQSNNFPRICRSSLTKTTKDVFSYHNENYHQYIKDWIVFSMRKQTLMLLQHPLPAFPKHQELETIN